MLFDFANVLIFLSVAAAFVFVSLFIGRLIRPQAPSPEKLATYECGEVPTAPAWVNFNIRFYMLALLFIIFDVEIAFMFPVGAVFRRWIREGSGALALAEIAVFVLILLLGLIYAWVKGDLEWVKKLPPAEDRSPDVVSKATKMDGVIKR